MNLPIYGAFWKARLIAEQKTLRCRINNPLVSAVRPFKIFKNKFRTWKISRFFFFALHLEKSNRIFGLGWGGCVGGGGVGGGGWGGWGGGGGLGVNIFVFLILGEGLIFYENCFLFFLGGGIFFFFLEVFFGFFFLFFFFFFVFRFRSLARPSVSKARRRKRAVKNVLSKNVRCPKKTRSEARASRDPRSSPAPSDKAPPHRTDSDHAEC